MESLLALSSTPSYSTLPSTIREQVSLTLYDALHDDDPDLREIAAEAAWRMLASIEQEITASTARVAPVAAERLLETLGAQHTTSQYLFDSALERVTGQRWNALSAVTHTSQVLRQLLDHKVTLFDVEKQNLYRDDAYEAEVWSSMLMRMSLETIAPATISAFAKWTVDGIDALTAQTQKDYDGPLGWTCKEEVFVLGMRIICAAKVVLAWRQRSRKVPIRASDVRRNLRVLADVGEAQALHPIWLQCIQKILERSVRQRLQRVAAMLASIEANVVSGQKV